MCGTRSPSRRAPATDCRAALIVAHGSPSSPAGPERAIRSLAARIARDLDGWAIEGATLAAPGALEAAVARLPDDRPLVYPFFMADGRFVRERLPRRLEACAVARYDLLRPLGLDPALHRLCLEQAREASSAAGFEAGSTQLLIAAHGSPSDQRSRRAAEAAARAVAAARVFREVRIGFVDEAPFLREAAVLAPPALCLPFFAGRAGHFETDLPAALADAGFPGPLLEAVGLHPSVPAIVAGALRSAATRRAA